MITKSFVTARYAETDQMGVIPVSYTHLDVYKRQVHSFMSCFTIFISLCSK